MTITTAERRNAGRPVNKVQPKAAPDVLRALIATWIVIEGDENLLAYVNNATNKATGETLQEYARAAIAAASGRVI